jgi:hypothetical protein
MFRGYFLECGGAQWILHRELPVFRRDEWIQHGIFTLIRREEWIFYGIFTWKCREEWIQCGVHRIFYRIEGMIDGGLR